MTAKPSAPGSLANVRGTELFAADTRERYREKLARITLDSMVQFVGLLDANGTVLEINQVALDAAGIKLSDVEGRPFWTTFWWQVSDEINATLRNAIRQAAQGELVRWDTEIYGRASGKQTIIIDASLMPVKDEQGNVAFITAEGRDITEKKAHEREIARQREELAKLDELKTQFLSNISHEFRTPLTLMMGPLEDAIAEESSSTSNRERLELANRNSKRLLKLVNTLLDFSRIEAGRIEASYHASSNVVYRMNPDWSEMRQLDGKGFIADTEGPNKDWMEQYIHPDDQPAVLSAVREAIRNKTAFELEHRVRRLDGTMGWTLSRAVPILDDSGEIIEWFGAASDVTGRKHEQMASQRLSAIVSSSEDAIISKDLKGFVNSWNAAAERIFGYSAEEIVGKHITTIIPPELHKDETLILETIARGERIEHFETVRVTKSGERIDVSLTVSPLKDEAGRVVGASKIARDITQRRKTERALHTAEKLASVGRLAATVAHEINNPLEALTNLIYLAKNAPDRENVQLYLMGAEEELERVSQLTKQTLGFYRETRGKAPIRVGSMVNSLLSVFAPRIRNKGIKVVPEIEGDPEINAVPGEIRQLIANLVSNSIDAVGRNGSIRIRVSHQTARKAHRTEGVRLTVADNGAGISAEARSQIFEPFFTTKKEVGTGLGLWVCKSIVEKHGGTIRVRSSTVPGKNGTVFSAFLALGKEEAIAISDRL